MAVKGGSPTYCNGMLLADIGTGVGTGTGSAGANVGTAVIVVVFPASTWIGSFET